MRTTLDVNTATVTVTTTAMVTRSSARAAAERVATQEWRDLRVARRSTEERAGDSNSTRRPPPVVGTGTGVFVGTAKAEAHRTAAGVVGVPSNPTADEWGDVCPSGREGKYVQSYWAFLCLLNPRTNRPSLAPFVSVRTYLGFTNQDFLYLHRLIPTSTVHSHGRTGRP